MCAPGEYSENFATVGCSPCPPGTYSDIDGGTECQQCGGYTYSPLAGSTSLDNCTACVPDYCNGNGECSLDMGAQATCSCAQGFSGDRCETQAGGSSTQERFEHTIGIILALIVPLLIVQTLGWMTKPVKEFHVFVSYRVASDAALARRVTRTLSEHEVEPGMRVRCFLDQKDISTGVNWQDAFEMGLQRSCLFLPLVSVAGMAPFEHVSVFDESPDNLLREFELALRLAAKGRIAILPLLVGDVGPDGEERPFSAFDVSHLPNGPSTTESQRPVRETVKRMLAVQGVFVPPSGIEDRQAEAIMTALRERAWRKIEESEQVKATRLIRLSRWLVRFLNIGHLLHRHKGATSLQLSRWWRGPVHDAEDGSTDFDYGGRARNPEGWQRVYRSTTVVARPSRGGELSEPLIESAV